MDVFFALSGWLIGGQLYDAISRGAFSIGAFWRRRWLRTVPAYVTWLAVYYLLHEFVMVRPPLEFPWRYLIYVQNLWTKAPAFFLASWSLAIEEWFYLLTPLLLLGAQRYLRPSPAFVSTACCLIAGTLVARHVAVLVAGINSASDLNNAVIFKLDAIGYGVAAVWAQRQGVFYDPNARKAALIVGGLATVTGIAWNTMLGLQRPDILPAVALLWRGVLIPIGVALMLPTLAGIKTLRFKFLDRSVTGLAVISYSVYLSNGFVVQGINHLSLAAPALLGWFLLLYWPANLVIGALSYRWVEVPFIRRYRSVGGGSRTPRPAWPRASRPRPSR